MHTREWHSGGKATQCAAMERHAQPGGVGGKSMVMQYKGVGKIEERNGGKYDYCA